MTAVPATFDHAPFSGTDDEVPEQPMVIAWEELDTTTYSATLARMAAWVDWLAEVYRPPTQVLPPCWYAHPAILEDLGHLWTGWLITRHPLSGVGMIGLDWDSRREHTFQRLRDVVAASGCTNRVHNRIDRRPSLTPADDLRQHLAARTAALERTETQQARAARAGAILTGVELRQDAAAAVLRDHAADPALATAAERDEAAQVLRALADQAPGRAATSAKAQANNDERDPREARLAQLREHLVAAIAEARAPRDVAEIGRAWAAALEELVPAADAIARAVAAAAARKKAGRGLAGDTRHLDARRILNQDG